METRFEDGTKVYIHSLGENTPGEYRAIIRGISVDGLVKIYIVEFIDRIVNKEEYPYRFGTIPESCLYPYEWED